MYEECLKCPKMGKSCDGPNFFAMSTPELLAWCKARKAELRLSNARLSELTGGTMPKGTIDRLFAGEHVDFRYETIRPLLKALTGGEWKGLPCAEPPADDSLQAKLERLEAELRWRDDKIQHITEENKRLREELKDSQEAEKEQLAFHRGEIKRKNRVTTILAVVMSLALAYIIATLIIDLLDPTQGFYWLESVLHLPQSIIERIKVNT